MRAKRIALLMIVAVLVAMLTPVESLLHNQIIEYADFEADRFGFPYYWIEHVSATFAGRADYWHLEILNLAKDVALYFMLSLVLLSLVLVFKRRGIHSRTT